MGYPDRVSQNEIDEFLSRVKRKVDAENLRRMDKGDKIRLNVITALSAMGILVLPTGYLYLANAEGLNDDRVLELTEDERRKVELVMSEVEGKVPMTQSFCKDLNNMSTLEGGVKGDEVGSCVANNLFVSCMSGMEKVAPQKGALRDFARSECGKWLDR